MAQTLVGLKENMINYYLTTQGEPVMTEALAAMDEKRRVFISDRENVRLFEVPHF